MPAFLLILGILATIAAGFAVYFVPLALRKLKEKFCKEAPPR